MIKLFWHPFAVMPWRVRIALHEKGVGYESILVDVYSSSHRSREFLTMSPFGQIPVIDVDGVSISESMAILEYIEEAFPQPSLSPATALGRAGMRELMCWGTDYWPGAWKKWMAPRLKGMRWTDDTVKEGRQAIAEHLDLLELRLKDSEWLVGAYSLADVCYAPMVLVLERVGLREGAECRPGVDRWVRQLKARPAVQATRMKNA